MLQVITTKNYKKSINYSCTDKTITSHSASTKCSLCYQIYSSSRTEAQSDNRSHKNLSTASSKSSYRLLISSSSSNSCRYCIYTTNKSADCSSRLRSESYNSSNIIDTSRKTGRSTVSCNTCSQ